MIYTSQQRDRLPLKNSPIGHSPKLFEVLAQTKFQSHLLIARHIFYVYTRTRRVPHIALRLYGVTEVMALRDICDIRQDSRRAQAYWQVNLHLG